MAVGCDPLEVLASNECCITHRCTRKRSARVYASGTIAHVHLAQPAEKAVALAELSRYPFLDVLDPQNLSAYARIGDSARIGDLLVSLQAGYGAKDSAFWPWFLRWRNWVGSGVSAAPNFKGMHGYDPARVPEIRGILFARGAEVRAAATPPGMRIVDVHPTVAYLPGIEPGNPVDGRALTELVARESI